MPDPPRAAEADSIGGKDGADEAKVERTWTHTHVAAAAVAAAEAEGVVVDDETECVSVCATLHPIAVCEEEVLPPVKTHTRTKNVGLFSAITFVCDMVTAITADIAMED